MPDNLKTSSLPEKLLYSYQKALDETLAAGALPRRLFRVCYPIRVIDVYGKQRIPTDMEEIQWFIERGIHEAGLVTSEELQTFLGLDAHFVDKLLLFLTQIGHLTYTRNKLTLTLLGVDSLEAGVCYQEYETSFMLYFDAFGNHPLSQEHFRIKVYESVRDNPGFWIFPPIFHSWDANSLVKLQKRNDKSRYGLMDEVNTILSSREDRIVYMPVYIVERVVDTPDILDLPVYLVFNTLKGYRDIELEQALNGDTIALDWLKNSGESLGDALNSRMDSFSIKIEGWQVRQNPSVGIEVAINTKDISRNEKFTKNNEPEKELTIQRIGKYLLASEWCVWLTCEDVSIRWEAGILNCLDWLENAFSEPDAKSIIQFVESVNERLAVNPAITTLDLQKEAKSKKKYKAEERLAVMF